MYKNLQHEEAVDRETLVPMELAIHLLGPDFGNWLARELGTRWRIYNFGWGDYELSFLVPIDLVLGGP